MVYTEVTRCRCFIGFYSNLRPVTLEHPRCVYPASVLPLLSEVFSSGEFRHFRGKRSFFLPHYMFPAAGFTCYFTDLQFSIYKCSGNCSLQWERNDSAFWIFLTGTFTFSTQDQYRLLVVLTFGLEVRICGIL